jgi:hypothetical protein
MLPWTNFDFDKLWVVVGFQQDNVMAHASIAPVVTKLCTGKIRFAAVFAGLEATGLQHLNSAV